MHWKTTLALLAGTLVAGGACAAGSQTGETRRGRDVIVAEQIAEAGLESETAWDVVERFRNDWLLGIPPTSPNDPPRLFATVYVDDIRMGGLEALRSVPAGDVREIRYVEQRDAEFRYGTGHRGGVIVVVTMGRRQ